MKLKLSIIHTANAILCVWYQIRVKWFYAILCAFSVTILFGDGGEKTVQMPGIIGRPFIKRFTLCYTSAVCPVCLSVTVYCGQTVGWIRMKLGMNVGLGPGHVALNGDPAIRSVLCNVHSAMHTHMNRLTVLWIGFCLTGPISLC